mgnify:CR=1 FL=1
MAWLKRTHTHTHTHTHTQTQREGYFNLYGKRCKSDWFIIETCVLIAWRPQDREFGIPHGCGM